MIIEHITPELAAQLCHKIIVDLPEYFGSAEANKSYMLGVKTRWNIAAKVDEQYVGLLSLDFPYPKSASIYWMGVMRVEQNKGVGNALILEAEKLARSKGVEFVTVETLSLVEEDINYKKTYNFYQSNGFIPIFDLKPKGYECMMVYMIKKLKEITEYNEVNQVLLALTEKITTTLQDNLVGIYLTGSLTYGDFDPLSSDIDLLVILKTPAGKDVLLKIQQMHSLIKNDNKEWQNRIECSYITLDDLKNITPPKIPRPYYNEGFLHLGAPYGNEWIINLYMLYEFGISLLGPTFKTLIKPIDIASVQEACIKDLIEEWQPKTIDPTYLDKSHHQAYAVLTICRILYTIELGEMASKKVSAAWAKNQFDKQWSNLITTAEAWHKGREMNLKEEVIKFIGFATNKITDFKT